MKLAITLVFFCTIAYGLNPTVTCADARQLLKRRYISAEMSSTSYMPGEMLHGRIRLTNTEASSILVPRLISSADYSYSLMQRSPAYPDIWVAIGREEVRNSERGEKGCFREVETLLPGESKVYPTCGSENNLYDQPLDVWIAPSKEGIGKLQFQVFDLKWTVDYNVQRPKTLKWIRVGDRRLVKDEFGSNTVVLVAGMQSQWLLLASANRFADTQMEYMARISKARPIDGPPWSGWDDASLVRIMTSDQPIKLLPRLFEKKDIASLPSLEVEIDGKVHSFEAILDNAQKMKKRFYSDPNVPRLTLRLGDPD